MEEYTPQITGYETLPGIEIGTNVSGFYRKVSVSYYNSYAEYYDESGVYQESGICYTYSGCTYYELIQYYDNNGNEELAVEDETYYYLATRDTNIIVMQYSVSSVPSSSLTKPYTLTSIYNSTNYRDSVTWTVSNSAVHAYGDVNIENIKINSRASGNVNGPSSTSVSTSRYFYGDYHNVRLGRGIVQSGSYKTFDTVLAGDNSYSGRYSSSDTGSSSSTVKYKIIIESGFYNSLSLANASYSDSSSRYLNGKAIYGNDYDKVTNNNSNLDIYFCASSSWGGGDFYSSNETTSLIFDFVVKSGKFGRVRVIMLLVYMLVVEVMVIIMLLRELE